MLIVPGRDLTTSRRAQDTQCTDIRANLAIVMTDGASSYRAWCFDTKAAGYDADPLTDYLVKDGDAFYGWIGTPLYGPRVM